MSIPLTINGAVFEYPVDFDENWGVDATGWAQAVTNGMLQMAGGSFPLTADVNFGPNFGLLSKYFETRSSTPATTGTVRLSSADAGIAWRNFANSGNNILTTDASNNLQYNGSTISGGVNAGTQYKLAYYATTSSNVSPNPNTTAATQVLVTDANGVPTTTGNGGTTATQIGFVNGVTSAIQTQLNARPTPVAPTIQRFLSGSGTYTTPTSPRTPLYLKVTLVGPGGGGSGGGTGANAGSAGSGATSFGAGAATAGAGGGGAGITTGGAGGTNALTTGATIIAILGNVGQAGGGSAYSTVSGGASWGGAHGGGTFLSAGANGTLNSNNGNAGVPNTGEGGAGGGSGVTGANNAGGSGGGGGGTLQYLVTSPSATYAYGIGTGGAGGTSTAGAGGAGGAGADGIVIVEEYYQ